MSDDKKFILKRSNRQHKKWAIYVPFDNALLKPKWVHFGDNRYEDYTQHKDAERARLYVLRHKKKEERKWDGDVYAPAFWARWLLWEKPSLDQAIKALYDNEGIEIEKQ